MKYLFLIATFDAFFFAALLVQKKPRYYHDNILIAWLIFLAAFIGVYSVYSHRLFTDFGIISNSVLSLFMLQGPFLYLYVSTLLTGKRFSIPGDLVHLAPFILFNVYMLIASFNADISSRMNIGLAEDGHKMPFLFVVFLIITVLSGPVYIILTIAFLREREIKIFNNYSSSLRVNPEWLEKLIIVFGIIWTLLMAVTVIHHVFNLFPIVFCTDGIFFSLSLFVILIGYFGLKQKVIFSPDDIISETPPGKTKPKYSGSKLAEADSGVYAEKVSAYMKEKEPYLDPDLTLSDLSQQTGIPSHYLSQVINEKFHKNFFDFINTYRVEAFTKKLSDPAFSRYSILGLAFECGFNSKSAFNRSFRQVTGKTPSEYRKNNG